MNVRRFITALYLLAFLAFVSGCGVFFWQTRQEYRQLLEAETRAKVRLAEVQERVREQEMILERLRTDPAYVEYVIRRRLGYAKPDELVFRFRDY